MLRPLTRIQMYVGPFLVPSLNPATRARIPAARPVDAKWVSIFFHHQAKRKKKKQPPISWVCVEEVDSKLLDAAACNIEYGGSGLRVGFRLHRPYFILSNILKFSSNINLSSSSPVIATRETCFANSYCIVGEENNKMTDLEGQVRDS